MLDDTEIASALERAGMEVEQINASTEIDKRVVVALVKKVVQHPEADRLRLVEVEIGADNYNIVCGAANVREGLKVALAQIGAVLPGGEKIAKAKLRGEVSEGMICSEFELGLGKDHNGILELSSDAIVGTPLCDMYPADTEIDLKTPANRFDVMSVVGLAREVAAMTKAELAPLSPPAVKISADGPAVEKSGVAARYMLARVKVDQGGQTPRDLAARLRVAGMRTVSPVVDVTNYVMLEYGQPLHAFDASKVHLPIAVRYARKGEKLRTLDDVQRTLSPDDLVIADTTGPIALAGLIGGASTEVSAGTKEVLLESAVFDGVTVRKMAKRHGLRTEASARFERGLPVQLPPLGLGRAVELLARVAGGKLVNASDQLNEKPKTRAIELNIPRLSKLLGFGITHKEAQAALAKLQIVSEKSKLEDCITVPEVPWWRPDLELPEDLAEEVVRVVGYDKVPSTIPSWRPTRLVFDRARAKRRQVRDLMYAAGLFEVMTYSFVSQEQLESLGHDTAGHLKLKNPLSTEQAYLRSGLLPSHLAVLQRNRAYAKEIGFYEISNVFVKRGPGEQPHEPTRLAVTMARPEAALAHLKGVLDALARELNVAVTVEPAADGLYAPGRSGRVSLGSTPLGWIGQVHPERVRALKVDGEVACLELDLTPLIEAAGARQFAGVERFPTIQRDLSALVPVDVTWAQVAEALAPAAVEYVSDYHGDELPAGTKGLTLRLTVVNAERTPTEAEANDAEARVWAVLERKVGAKRRA